MKSKQAPPPPGYVKLVETLMQLTERWCGEQPGLPDLRWLDPGDTMFVGPLCGPAVKYLADSPDAFRLVEWLDVQTNREATLFQLTVALRMLGHLPGGPEVETMQESLAMKGLKDFAFKTGSTTETVGSPCGHCGRVNDLASGEKGHRPGPGAFAICALCGGINQYGADLRLVRVDETLLEALPADDRGHLLEMQALMRAARMGTLPGKRGVEA